VTTELTAASRHQHLVLYDPAAIPDTIALDPDLDAQAPNALSQNRLAEIAAGRELPANWRAFLSDSV
jgi:hypothetical protein